MNAQLEFEFTKPALLDTIRGRLREITEAGFAHPNAQATVVGATGAVLARSLAFVSHEYGLTPYYTAILFETAFPAILVLIQQRMSGQTWTRSIKASLVASFVGFAATASTGIISH